MEATVDRPDDRDALARRAGVSLRQLERLFKLHLGSTVGASYMSIRLEHADMLLRNTNEPILAVAISCGFTSSSHFSRRFKEKFGRAPSLRIRR
jgi:transcriptional regulator GlxA family with amidase domain